MYKYLSEAFLVVEVGILGGQAGADVSELRRHGSHLCRDAPDVPLLLVQVPQQRTRFAGGRDGAAEASISISINLSLNLSIYQSIYLCMIFLPVAANFCLSVCLSV